MLKINISKLREAFLKIAIFFRFTSVPSLLMSLYSKDNENVGKFNFNHFDTYVEMLSAKLWLSNSNDVAGNFKFQENCNLKHHYPSFYPTTIF